MGKNKHEKPAKIEGIVFKIEDNKKIYYSGNNKIGEEYDVVRLFIDKGFSSSRAHKDILKVKEQKI